MASRDGNVENGEPLTPKKIAPRASSRENSPVTQPPRKNLPDNCSAVQAGKKRRHEKAAKKLPKSIRRAQKSVDRSRGDTPRHQVRLARVQALLLSLLAIQIPKAHLAQQAG